MRRLLVGLACVVVVLGIAVAALPLFVSSDTVRSRILTKLEEMTGRTVGFKGDPTVTFNPFLGIELSELEIADPTMLEGGKPLLSVEMVQAQMDILPALFGEVSISRYRLVRPELNLKTQKDGVENWKFEKGTIRESMEDQADDESASKEDARLGAFEIVDGVIFFDDAIAGITEQVTNIQANLNWPQISSTANLAGTAVWRGESLVISTEIGAFTDLVSGENSELSFDFQSNPLSIRFSGTANLISDLFLTGDITASSPSVSRMSEFINMNLGDTGPSGQINISGILEGTATSAKITEAEVGLAGLVGNGAISISIDELKKAKLDGTLAFDTIDLSTYVSEQASVSDAGLDPERIEDLEIDFRVSADTVKIGPVMLNNVASTIAMGTEGWVFDIGYSESLEGTVISKFGQRKNEDDNQAFLTISARDINTDELSEFLEEPILSINGIANIDADLRTKTLSSGDLFRGLNGVVEVNIDQGAVIGMDLQSLLSSSSEDDENDIQTSENLEADGSTQFNSMTITSFLNNGVASIAKANIDLDELTIQVRGDVSLADKGIALRAQAVSKEGPEPARLFFGGTYSKPLVSLQIRPVVKQEQEPNIDLPEVEQDGLSN